MKITVHFHNPVEVQQAFTGDELKWTNHEGYLRIIRDGERLIAEYAPGTWKYVFLAQD